MNQEKLGKIAQNLENLILESKDKNNYFSEPFQHIVLDNVFPETLAKNIMDSFPSLENECWDHSKDEGIEVKSRTTWNSEFDIPDIIIDAVRIFNSAQILRSIGKVFDIPKLMPDPYFSGGGLNVSEKGGHLDIHVDGNYHDASGMNRRVNLLFYLNPNWEKSWGGELGMYNNSGNDLVKSVEPLFNRCVIFDTHDKSFHGLPNKINFPKSEPRKSIILYYYTVASRPEANVSVKEPHSALWKTKGFTDKKGKKGRDFW